MPGYGKHMALTMWVCVIILLITYRIHYLSSEVVLFVCGALAAAKYVSPDLDMKGTIPSRSWGVFQFMLIPYRHIPQDSPPHRGISHHPIWGPLTLIPYVMTCFSIIIGGFIVFVLPVVNAAAEYLCMIAACVHNGTPIPAMFWINVLIVVAAAVFVIEVHILYDRVGNGE